MNLHHPTIYDAIQRHMATGKYESPEDVVIHALQRLDEYADSVADLQESLADEEAGRVRPLTDVAEEIRAKHGFSKPS